VPYASGSGAARDWGLQSGHIGACCSLGGGGGGGGESRRAVTSFGGVLRMRRPCWRARCGWTLFN